MLLSSVPHHASQYCVIQPSNYCLAFSQIITSLTLSPAICFTLIHTNRRVSICSAILQREMLNLEFPSATVHFLFLPCFFLIVFIVDLAYHIQHLNLLYFSTFPLGNYFFLILIIFLTLFCLLMPKII